MRPLFVSEVNNYIKKVFASDILLTYIQIEGEISNFTHHYSGHMYFSLKDEKSRIKCVMFKADNEEINFKPKDGTKVVVSGSIGVYEKDGSYQVYIRQMEKQGLGGLYRAFEELKKKLSDEGLFDPACKIPIPSLPRKIGIVTSSTGAAIRDLTSILKRRFPAVSILLYPALVQGAGAAKDIIKALKYLDNEEDIDLIIVGRGGGSFEELSAFNDEALARCIFSLKKPVISAVGHETDYTISDFVADVRAATPSAAAEIAVPARRTMLDELDSIGKAAVSLAAIKLSRECRNLQQTKRNLSYVNPEKRLSDKHIELDKQFKRLEHTMFRRFTELKSGISVYESRLGLTNPRLPLERGYGIIVNATDGRILRSAFDVSIEQKVSIRMKDGVITTEVIDVLKEAADE